MRFKRMTEIYSRLVDHTITNTNEVNDFSVGSAMRAMYEAVSIELEQFYILTRENIREAIEQGVYSSFGFERKKALRAYGVVRIDFHNTTQHPIVIPRGSAFMSSHPEYTRVYETLEDYVIPVGSVTSEVEVFCTVPGEAGNIPEGTINLMRTPIANVKTVRNTIAFQTGQDEEPLEEMRARFRSYIESLSRATIAALEYGTREVEEISGVYIDEKVGLVTVYAHDRNGNLFDNLKAKVEENLERYRPAGIALRVKPVTRKMIDVEVEITVSRKTAITASLQRQIEHEIARYLNRMQTSQHLILSDLNRAVKVIDRTLIYDVKFLNIKENVYLEGHEVIRAGDIKVKLI